MPNKRTPTAPSDPRPGNNDQVLLLDNSKYKYCYTLNNYTESDEIDIINWCKKCAIIYIVGREICPTTGTPHLQGYFRVKDKIRWTTCMNQCTAFKRARPELNTNGNDKANLEYCSKGGIFKTNMRIPKPVQSLKPEELYSWQKNVINIINQPANDRDVRWFWDDDGNTGKSKLCKYILMNYHSHVISKGRYSDIINVIFNMEDIDSDSVIVIDIPRNQSNHVSYDAIESIKNGFVCNTKYETGQKIFNPPHVLIFCNYPPDTSQLSEDRWIITKIDKPTPIDNSPTLIT